MPSGAKKRKAAKKKKVNDSSTAHSHHGDNDGGEIVSPTTQDHREDQTPAAGEATVEVEKREDCSSENKSFTVQKDSNKEEGNIEIDIASKSKKSNHSSSSSSSGSDDDSHFIEKKVVVLESAPEAIPPKLEELEVSAIAEPVKLVDSPLEEALQKNDENVDQVGLIDDCSSSSVVVESVLKENGVSELPLSDEKAFLEASPVPLKGSVSGVNGADCVNETETIEYSDRQPLVASTPLAVQKTTSWKGCCGILELFSGSERN